MDLDGLEVSDSKPSGGGGDGWGENDADLMDFEERRGSTPKKASAAIKSTSNSDNWMDEWEEVGLNPCTYSHCNCVF